MTRLWLVALLTMPLAGIGRPTAVWAQDPPSVAGRWSLNRELSQAPREIGFTADWMSAGGSGDDSASGGGRGGSGGGGRTKFPVSRESREDATRREVLTAEVREPSPFLTITETASDVTITIGNGPPRTFHPANPEDVLQLDGATVIATARWEGARLVVLYKVEQGRTLRYTYSRNPSPPQLVVDVQFLERGKGDSVRHVYEPVRQPSAITAAPTASAPPAPSAVPSATPSAATPTAQLSGRQPDSPLKGLTSLGVVVEGLSAQAETCGLRQDAIESAVVKQLSGAGLKVVLNTDEDTYVYINVMTATMSNGLCITRYDAYLYTHTQAKLQYHDAPVLVDVSLLHKGSLAAGAAAAHAESVMKGVRDDIGQFATQIRDANT